MSKSYRVKPVLVQVVMPDAEYRAQANELAIALSEPHVKGVFEERLPLDLHAAIQLGCVTAVLPECRSKSMQDGFDLTDLQVCLHRLERKEKNQLHLSALVKRQAWLQSRLPKPELPTLTPCSPGAVAGTDIAAAAATQCLARQQKSFTPL